MTKVLVVGNGGSGKSTFSKKLGTKLKVPVVHLDEHYWKPGWMATPTEEWRNKVHSLMAADAWIMDGNYSGTMSERVAAADTIIYFRFPRLSCILGVYRRRFSKRRIDPIPGCPEKVDLEFLQWIWGYPRKVHPAIIKLLYEAAGTKHIAILRNRKDVERFLNQINTGNGDSMWNAREDEKRILG